MRLFITGGSGVMGRACLPLLREAGHEVKAPGSRELDLFNAKAVSDAIAGSDAILHMATRIPGPDRAADPLAWSENDRLRTQAMHNLVEAAMVFRVSTITFPSVAFLYPAGSPADESTPIGKVSPRLQSAVFAEGEVDRFIESGGRGVVLRLGLLWGPGTGNDEPVQRYGSTLQIEDAGRALAAALSLPSGVYNVVSDGELVSNERFKAATGWQPAF